jgi:AmmeMemoRadiSam system protein B
MPIRRAAVAGTWYPGDAASLAAEVDGYLAGVAAQDVPGRLVALISPHAGLRYSGPVAAHAYALLRGRRDLTAVLVGPSHHAAFDGVSVYARGAFTTPLGEIPIDEALAGALLDVGEGLLDEPSPHGHEHSLEMQLPFLQHLVPGLRLVPLLMGSQARGEVDALAAALAEALEGRDALLVASSDLSHYHPAPVANELDAKVVGDVRRFDPEGLMGRLESFRGHACGGGPMVAVLKAARARGADHATVLRYADSGDVEDGDKSRVVGYLAAALTASGPA